MENFGGLMDIQDEQNTILIVDDIEMNREILDCIFNHDYKTVQFDNGLDAFLYTQENNDSIVAVLLDITMPILNGYGYLEKIRENNLLKGVPVFIITAEDKDQQLDAFEYRISDIIEKPFNPAFLFKRVTSQIELFKLHRSLEYKNLLQEREIARKNKEFSEINVKVISTLALSIEFRSGETGKHVLSIRNITYRLLQRLRELQFKECANLSDEDINNIAYASILHDIGKIAIPDAILNKPGRLTPEEFNVIKTHTIRGAELIQKIGIKTSQVLEYAYDICLHHHERYDGRGYPEGLKGDELSVWSQVVGIADVYDALTQERCYKKAFPHEVALDMICSNQCGVFNPELVEVFQRIIGDIVRDDIHREIPALAFGNPD